MHRRASGCALNVVLAAAWVVSLCCILSSCRGRLAAIAPAEPEGRLRWSAASGVPAPGGFIVLLVPKPGTAMRSTDGGGDQPLVRAVHATLQELGSGVVALTCNSRTFEVPSGSLALAAPGAETDRFVEALVAEYRGRPGGTRQFSVQLRPDGAAPGAVVLRVRSSEAQTERLSYRLAPAGPIPVRWTGYNRMDEVLSASRPGETRLLIVHTIAALAATMGLAAVGRWGWRRTR